MVYDTMTALSMFNERGKKFRLKEGLSQQLRNEQSGIDVEEFGPNMRTENNMGVFIEGSALYKQASMIEAKKEIETMEYKESVNIMNSIRGGFEGLKNDLYYLADYKAKNWDNIGGVSKQEPIEEVEFLHDLILLPDQLDQSIVLSFDGSTIQGPNGDQIPISSLPKLMPAEIGESVKEPLNELIQQASENKLNGRQFNQHQIKTEIKIILDNLKKQGGIKAIKSLAYDVPFSVGETYGTFMDDYFDQEDITGDVKEWESLNPTENIEDVKRGVLPTLWHEKNSDEMENLLENWLLFKVKDNYDLTEDTSKPKSPTSNMTPKEKLEYYRNLSK